MTICSLLSLFSTLLVSVDLSLTIFWSRHRLIDQQRISESLGKLQQRSLAVGMAGPSRVAVCVERSSLRRPGDMRPSTRAGGYIYASVLRFLHLNDVSVSGCRGRGERPGAFLRQWRRASLLVSKTRTPIDWFAAYLLLLAGLHLITQPSVLTQCLS